MPPMRRLRYPCIAFWAGIPYVVINLLYSFWLKSKVIPMECLLLRICTADCCRCFCHREGGVRLAVYLTPFSSRFFLAFASVAMRSSFWERPVQRYRANLREYSTELLDEIISIVTSNNSHYALYGIDKASPTYSEGLKYTSPLLFMDYSGIFTSYTGKRRGESDRITAVRPPLLTNGFLWLAVVFWVLYYS